MTDFPDAAHFERYLAHLRRLVAVRSPFTEPELVEALMGEVAGRMAQFLRDHDCGRDRMGNLVCVPRTIDIERPILYLSAHVDTVPGDPSLWTAPFAPHPPFESGSELVAQGVNDCKAGVAAELWLAELSSLGRIQLDNVVFTVTFKEEGAGAKSGVALGEALGRTLPAPTPGSALLVLENSVTSSPPYLPQVYAAENSSFTIRITGSVRELRAALEAMPDWKPVSIVPVSEVSGSYAWVHHAPLGHVCSAPADANPLKAALAQAPDDRLLIAGDERSHGTVPAAIGEAHSPVVDAPHRLTLTKRGNHSYEEVVAELEGRTYEAVKPLRISGGFDATARLPGHAVGRAFLECEADGSVVFQRNIGASDATIITSSMDPSLRPALLPLVCGPGTRSRRSVFPPRLTHGPNETFVKEAGRGALGLIIDVLARSGHVRFRG